MAGVESLAAGAGRLRFRPLGGGLVGVSLGGSTDGEGGTSSRARVRVDLRGSDMTKIDARGQARWRRGGVGVCQGVGEMLKCDNRKLVMRYSSWARLCGSR